MCKLCNTDKPPFNPSKKGTTTSKELYEFTDVCKDYFDEVPCKTCRTCYSVYLNRQKNKNNTIKVDTYIINKLFSTRVKSKVLNWRNFYRQTVEKINAYDIDLKKEKVRKAKKAKTTVPVSKSIFKNIYESHCTYRVQFTVNKKRFSKTFNTLTEAKNYYTKCYRPKSESGYYGISFNKVGKVYVARLGGQELRGKAKLIYCGQYKTLVEAQRALNKARKENNLKEVNYEN